MDGNLGNPEIENKNAPIRQATQDSQTASDFIDEQLALEADAREVLPYKFDKCTYDLGPIRQSVFACLTCNPPPASAAQQYRPAGVCYSCSISCHGEHTLVELFTRRNFVCDCGTSRIQSGESCTLRLNTTTGVRGVRDQEPAAGNHYNHNYQNRFCACGEEYDPHSEKGTMFQCLGLGTVESGGCGEDWYHPECLMGLPRDWYKDEQVKHKEPVELAGADDQEEDTSHPVPPGFPAEDEFESLICYKCVESNPWLKSYAGTRGFLPPIFRTGLQSSTSLITTTTSTSPPSESTTLKRKASDTDLDSAPASPSKRVKDDPELSNNATEIHANPINPTTSPPTQKHDALPPPPSGQFSIFAQANFREHLCHCPTCYPHLIPYPQLVEEEETYEPSMSDSEASSSHPNGAGHHSNPRSHGTASLLDRGEAALSGMDRVKAIEGVMVYNHLRDKVKEFLKPYAESGQAVSADDIKAYFEKLRGDEGAIKEASAKPPTDGNDDGGDGSGRREQSGY